MSGVFAKRLGRRYSRDSVAVSSVKYSVISALVFRHVKYVYDWVKPTFARYRIGFGRVNASARKITSGRRACTLAMSHFPEGEGFGVGIVDAERAHAVIDPEQRDLEQRAPERPPVLGFEV